MADRTVTVRLRLDATQWAAGQSAAVRANDRLSASSRAAATRAERDAQRAATAVAGTFSGMARTGEAALGRLDAAAARSSQALARSNAAAASVRQVSLAGSAGARDLSLANRLAMAQAAQASRAAAGAAAGTTSAYARVASAAQVAAARVEAGGARTEQTLRRGRMAALGLVAVFGAAVVESSRFESAMSRVKAATQAPAHELGQLRQAAIQAGSSTQYSAAQSADAITELAKAGVSTSDILGGALKGTLSLAAAGEMNVGDSAVVAAKAMNSFGLSGKDMAHIADVIAAAAGKSATDVHGMSLAMAQSALLAHQTGLTLEQTAGSLALFAQNGLVGSDAGTSLKTMLMRLTPQSAEARDTMAKLGFSAYDANGQFVGLSEVARRMQKSFGGLSPEARNAAMSVIFGSDAIRAATIVTQAGAQGIDAWTKAANDQGYAARFASTQTDNLQGDLKRLQSALETALIQGGTAANGVLRDMAKVLTAVIRWYSELPAPIQQGVTVLAGLAGVIGLVSAGLLLMLPRIAATRTALADLGVSAERVRGSMGLLGRTSLVVAGLTAVSYASSELRGILKDAPPSVSKMADSLVDLAAKGKAAGELTKTFGSDLQGFGEAVQRIAHPDWKARSTDIVNTLTFNLTKGLAETQIPLDKAHDQVDALDQALASLVQSGNADVAAKAFGDMAKQANASHTSTEKLNTLLPQYTDALASLDTQNKLTGGSQKQLADAETLTSDAMQNTRTEAEKLTAALDALNGVNIDAATSEIDFRQSLADMRQAVKDNGRSLDITTDKGRKVKGAFLDMARAAQTHAEAIAKLKDSQAAGDKALTADIAVLKAQMIQMGFQRKTVDRLLAAYLSVPGQVTTKVSADTGQALRDLQAVRDKLTHTTGKSITISALTGDAEKTLTSLGYRVAHLPKGLVRVSAPTSGAEQAIARLQAKVTALEGTHRITLLTENRTIYTGKGGRGPNAQADGSVRHFAGGGMEQHVAQIARPGEWRVWAEDETGGEAYIPLAASKRRRSRLIAEETVRRLGGRGVAWNAGGSVRAYASGGFTYTPADPTTTLGVNAGWDRYNNAVSAVNAAGKALATALAEAAKKAAAVRDAERNLSQVRSRHHTAAQLAAAEERLAKAREASAAATKKVAGDRRALNAADAAAGVRAGTTSIGGFNLAVYEKQLAAANSANAAWEKNLATVGKRAGQDVEGILRGMGSDGTALVAALAKATGSQFAKIVAQLKALGPTAKASLADYTRQLTAANKGSAAFQANLLKLAAMGDTALASQLAAQGDDAAAAIAAQAVKSPSAAGKANASAKANASLLTSQDLADAVTLLGVLKSKKGAGIADVIAAGLDWSTLRALAPKIAAQIRAVPGSGTFVGQLRGQGVAMAQGGILSRPTVVLGGEAGVRESWIPWTDTARSRSLLSATAAGMGYQLVPAGRWAGQAPAAGGGTTHVDRSQTVHLHGAHQGLAEQRADLLRHMAVLA